MPPVDHAPAQPRRQRPRSPDRIDDLSPSLLDKITSRCAIAPHQLHRARQAIALLLLALALLMFLQRGPDHTKATIALRAIAAGEEFTTANVAVHAVEATSLAPSALITKDQAIGSRAATPIRAGEIITDARLLTPRIVDETSHASGARAVPVRLSDPAVTSLLQPGDRVDVVAVPPGSELPASVLAKDVAVLFTSTAGETSGALAVLALGPAEAVAVAAHAAQGIVTVTLR
ncbi:SAF domain-containing protein [Lolliginicoccus levis]|uniref:SAF domain-containing protein n=1 Tax=Lolliginicoccus levis TaxID=2919542 RepID=UPI00241D2BFE|nr:SAF domain-containing protein [Lolliginicoccus levis]